MKLRLVGRGGGGKGGHVFIRVPNSLEGCDGWGEGGEYYIYQSLGGTVERYMYAPGRRVAHLG